MEDIYLLVGRRIREERKRAGLTLEEISEISDITPSFLAYVERGQKKASLDTIQKLANALRTPVSALFSTVLRPSNQKEYETATRIATMLKKKKPTERNLILKVVKLLSKK